MFESLTDRFDAVFSRLRGRGRLSEADVDEALREIRLALLQADVNLRVVRDFVSRVREQLVGMDLSQSLTPGQQVVKVVHDELRTILGGEALQAHLRVAAADGHPPRRPAGIRQDHDGRQAGRLVQAAGGSQPAARRRRPAAPGRRRAAPGPRRPGRGPGLQRAVRSRHRGQEGPGGGRPARPRRAHRRHRRPAVDRRRADGGGPADLRPRSSRTTRSSSSTP